MSWEKLLADFDASIAAVDDALLNAEIALLHADHTVTRIEDRREAEDAVRNGTGPH